jgi:hypothetical protein
LVFDASQIPTRRAGAQNTFKEPAKGMVGYSKQVLNVVQSYHRSMPKTGSDGAKDVFFSHENILRKEYPSHHSNPNCQWDLKPTYVGIHTQSTFMSVRKEIDKPNKHIKKFH